MEDFFDPLVLADGNRPFIDSNDRLWPKVRLEVCIRVGIGGSIDLHHLKDGVFDLLLCLEEVARVYPQEGFVFGNQNKAGTAGKAADECPTLIGLGYILTLVGIGSVDDPAIETRFGHHRPKGFNTGVDYIHYLVLL